jgi:hypothetical protein
MARRGTDVMTLLLGSAVLVGGPLLATSVRAQPQHTTHARPATHHPIPATYHPTHPATLPHAWPVHGLVSHGKALPVHSAMAFSHARLMRAAHHPAYGGISCVPYARQVSGIEVGGNAWQWWDNAAGRYARGNRPEPGSVLAFRSNPRMRLGHVAVVRTIINAREILIDQANWPSAGMRGGVSRGTAVIDVSEANDWTAVRVELGRGDAFGAVYPTYGFIYSRPDTGVIEAALHRPAPPPALNPAPTDLRPAAERPWHSYEEVAEAPSSPARRIDLSVGAHR